MSSSSPAQTYGLRSLGTLILTLVLVWTFDITFAQTMDAYFFAIIMYSGINIILAVSLNLVNGFTGQFSIGHAGFMSLGAYTSALITTTIQHSWPDLASAGFLLQSAIFLPALLAGCIVAAIAGVIVGLPSLRLRGDYLAIVTLGFGEIIRVLLLNTDLVGGARGMPGIPLLSSFGWVFTFAVLTIFVSWRVVHSAQGRTLLAIREDEIAADAMGVNTTSGKVKAFVIGAFFAGLAGGLFAHYLMYLNTSIFDFNRSFEIIIMVVLGGMGSISGSVVAAVLLTILKEALRPLKEITQIDLRMVIYALVLIVLMLTRPQGLFGTKEIQDLWRRLRKGKASQP